MKKQIKFLAYGLFAAETVAAVILAVSVFSPEKPLVAVDDRLYDAYIKEDFSSKIEFIKKSEFPAKKNAAASVTMQTYFPALENSDGTDKIYFELESECLFPSVKADFSAPKKAQTVLSPGLSVSLTDAQNIPQGFRALPVNEKYAGEEGYALEKKSAAVCEVYNSIYKKEIEDECARIFVFAKKAARTVFLGSVGDMMVARGVQEILLSGPDGIQKVFRDTLPILQSNDIMSGNLEGVITDSLKNAAKTYTFRFNKKVLPELKRAGFNYLMQTNNHCYDFGEEGFRETMLALKEYGIPTSGAGMNINEAQKFYTTSIKGQEFSIISCGAYPVERSGFDGKKTASATETRAGILWESPQLIEAVKKEASAGRTVVVNVHGGQEYSFVPTKKQRDFYEKLCEAGAAAVLGSHPHVLQPVEWHGKSLIAYSQGNFIFNGMEEMYGATDSEIIRLGFFKGRPVYAERYQARIDGTSVSLGRLNY